MLELDEKGLLEQPHTSAGRIPTDKGYRYFVDRLMDWEESLEEEVSVQDILEKIHEEHLGLFTTLASFGKRIQIESFGFEEVLRAPEFETRELAIEFGKLADNLERVAEHYLEVSISETPRAFIGRENPDVRARDFGAVSIKFKDDKLGEGVVFSIGPKRMDYEEVFKIYSLWKKKF